ncbi:MAG TPA: hypothetical protein VER35_01240 [Candidatus Limnocylindrales bacterium]|nr:hypothetical protein [Candidatus Limnocylindrales bacterium]
MIPSNLETKSSCAGRAREPKRQKGVRNIIYAAAQYCFYERNKTVTNN